MTTAMQMPDVRIENCYSVMSITPMNQTARDWINENVQAEGWQWLGASLHVEPRYADAIADGMIADGLQVA